jgi:hypothetical protein
VFLGDGPKRAVAQRDNAVFEMRLVAVGGDYFGQAPKELAPREVALDLGLGPKIPPVVTCDRGQVSARSQVVLASIEQRPSWFLATRPTWWPAGSVASSPI